MYRKTKLLCCITGTNIVLWVNDISKQTDKLIEKKSDLWLPKASCGERGNWMKVVKRYKLSVIR